MQEANPERFRHDQEIYRESYERTQAGTHIRMGNRLIPVELVPLNIDQGLRTTLIEALIRLEAQGTDLNIVMRARELRRRHQEAAAADPDPIPHARCAHMIRPNHQCTRGISENGMCRMHHRMMIRRDEERVIAEAHRAIDRLRRIGAPIIQIDARIDQYEREGLPERGIEMMRRRQNFVATEGFRAQLRDAIQQGRQTLETLTTLVNEWRAAGFMTGARCDILIAEIPNLLAWHGHGAARAGRQNFGPDRREAQLAADPQNVHTSEISQQMRESIEVLTTCYSDIPSTQTNTMAEILASWERIAPPPLECIVNAQRMVLNTEQRVNRTYRDLVSWWNRETIFNPGDKLFRKCVRALWWTIKQFPNETRTELEKRFWEECESGVDMCTQGHMARLSNVMVGYHDAYKPQVSNGEILQQRMAAISQMAIHESEQRRLAVDVLSELKIPQEQHAAWLEAF
jgi:hypothetical protein